jgi:hypothetical protein
MPDYIDWFVNREKQYQGFQKMLAGETPKSVMVVEAPADMGKTWLIQKMRHYCGENSLPALSVDFRDRRPHDYLSLVRLARDQMGAEFFNPLTTTINNFTSVNVQITTGGGGGGVTVNTADSSSAQVGGDVAGRDIIKDNQFFIQADSDIARRAAESQINDAFFAGLTQLVAAKSHAVFLFDSCEDITTEADRWLKDYLLARVPAGTLAKAIIVLAGRKTPELGETLKEYVARTGLDLFTEDHVKEYIVDKRKITGLDLATIYKTSGGQPGLLAKMADVAGLDTEKDEDWLK